MVTPINDFKELLENNILSISHIEWWLLKYSKVYKNEYKCFYSQYLFELEDGTTVRLPPCGKKTETEKFLDLYKALDNISQFHRNEKYFEQEVITYLKIKESKKELKAWALKNEELGANKYVCFLLDYLDYDEDEKVNHLSVFVPSLKDLDIFVDRQDFKFTIEFLEIFNEIYWVQEILPESLENIRSTLTKNTATIE